ncbi:DUF4401 domain-containing protein [Spongiimicrobium sp. 3-5]|uniref:DUF4401 domain-containing protein n=1 Tax=Spongiimicrobium sp. 3-5 TaxID=3332596 RepID=UPI0039807B97
MNREAQVQDFLKTISKSEGDGFKGDEQAILEEYVKKDANRSGLAIKIMSVLGGFLATIAFLGFLFIAGLYDSDMGLLLFGSIFIGAAIWLNKVFDKLIIDTLSISMYIIGLLLLGFGMAQFNTNEDLITISIIAIGAGTLMLTQTYVLSFITFLTIAVGTLVLMMSNFLYDFIHLYNTCVMVLLTYVVLNEAKIITMGKKMSRLYDPIRIGLAVALLVGLVCIGKRDLIPISIDYVWVSAIPALFIVIYLVYRIIKILGIENLRDKILIYSLTTLILATTIFSPSILGAMVLVLLSFLVNYKTSFALGIVALAYFISQYYYDLGFTLLTKSMILFSTGLVFILCYVLSNKKRNEKI